MSEGAEITTNTTPTPDDTPILGASNGDTVNNTLLGDTSTVDVGSDNSDGQQAVVSSADNQSQQVKQNVGLAPLPENANEDQKADFEKKLRALNGTPDSAEGYGDFGFGDAVKIDTNSEDYKYYSKLFHEVGLSKAQAKKLLEGHQKYAQEAVEHAKRTNDEQITEYRRKVKNDFIKQCGGEAQFNEFNQTAIRGFKAASQGAGLSENDMKGILNVMGDDPRFVKIFNAIGKMHREDVLVTGAPPRAQEKTYDQMFSEMFKASE